MRRIPSRRLLRAAWPSVVVEISRQQCMRGNPSPTPRVVVDMVQDGSCLEAGELLVTACDRRPGTAGARLITPRTHAAPRLGSVTGPSVVVRLFSQCCSHDHLVPPSPEEADLVSHAMVSIMWPRSRT
jgi:hypothetical protein